MIEYVVGDATKPVGSGRKIISHICNDSGYWGAGFTAALSKTFPQAEREYRDWYNKYKQSFALGLVRFVDCGAINVANMIAQHGVGRSKGVPPIRYAALASCLETVAYHAKNLEASIHMPKIGCGLAGGSWDMVEPIIKKTCKDVSVTVYDLEKTQ